MTEENQEKPLDLGLYGKADARVPLSAPEMAAAALCLIWAVSVAIYFVLKPSEGGALGVVLALLVVLLPIALIWVVVTTSRSIRVLRDEAGRLQAAVDAMRNAYVQQTPKILLANILDLIIDLTQGGTQGRQQAAPLLGQSQFTRHADKQTKTE